jgi:NTP pyrophosphatase (non-canonical NTP hydrolase)
MNGDNHNQELKELLNSIFGSISEIQEAFGNYQSEYFQERSPQFFCLELNGEAGELANTEKKIWKGRENEESKLADEAADVFIALFNYVNSRNIKLEESIINKLKKIEQIRLERETQGLEY